MTEPAQSTVVYRQRLTGLGWAGVVAALGGPVVLGFVLGDYVDSLGNRYYRPEPPAVESVLLCLLSLGGWIMILVGREHYRHETFSASDRGSTQPAQERDESTYLTGN